MSTDSSDKSCAACGAAALMRCSACKAEGYCSRECQREHWKAHKAFCTARKKGAGALRGPLLDS